MEAERLYRAKAIITAPGAAFLAVRRGRIAAVGPAAAAAAFARAGAALTDFGNAVILPGLWDAHVHLLLTGLSRRYVDLAGAHRLDDIVELVRGAASPAGEVLICAGADETRLAEGRLPAAAELDAAAPSRPVVVIRVDAHSLVVNGAAWRFLDISASWPGVELEATGRPTGRLFGRANELARARIYDRLDAATKAAAYRDAAASAASRGVVALCALEGGQLFGDDDVRVLMSCRDELPVEVFIFPQIPVVAAARELGLPRIGGCILVDGSFGSWTAALGEPYADRPTMRGELYFADDDLNAFVLTAHAAGLQVALHAIGDRAVAQVLDAYELAQREYPRPEPRHRLEHGELISARELARAAALGVVLSCQPAFEWFWGGAGGMYELRLGTRRRRRTNPLRSALRAGVRLAGGSDANITPLEPLLGIAAAMTHPTEEERLSFDEALAAFTSGAAASVFAENDWGALAPGKWASFTVVTPDPRLLPPAKIAEVQVVATVVKGETVYRRPASEAA